MQDIFLDTDFLLQCVRWKIDLFTEIERLFSAHKIQLFVFDRTLDELQGKKDSTLALAFTKKTQILKTGSNLPVDDLFFIYCKKNAAVATQDKILKEKLKKADISVITIRKQRHLVIENHVL